MPERRRASRRVAGILAGAVVDHGDRVGDQVRVHRRRTRPGSGPFGSAGSAASTKRARWLS